MTGDGVDDGKEAATTLDARGRTGVQARTLVSRGIRPLLKTYARAITFIRGRLKLRSWIAVCLIVSALLSIPLIWSSRFVSHRRAVLHLKRAQAHLAARELEHARTEAAVCQIVGACAALNSFG
jgi:hypothetical protein